MVVYYLDTSAILKRYRTEKGTEVVEALYGLPDVFLVTSHVACLEVEAVSAKLLKGKSLTEEAYDALLNAFAAGTSGRACDLEGVIAQRRNDAFRHLVER